MVPGPRNLITDITGLKVGNCSDEQLKSGVTSLVCETENTASVHVMGGAPGTRETDLLRVENTVQSVDAIILSGGSAFGLDAAGGAQSALRELGRGFQIREHRIPVVPAAIIFDLSNGGNKDWGKFSPYRELGYQAIRNAAPDFYIGSHGCGTGALVGGPGTGLKGGLGSASTVLPNGISIGALIAVNSLGAATVGNSRNFWAAPFEIGDEFGGLGWANVSSEESREIRIKFRDNISLGTNTVIGIIATDAKLSKAQCKKLAISAHDGIARAIWPAHTQFDGDLLFGLATGTSQIVPDLEEQLDLGAIAASTVSRAIARGIFAATSKPDDLFPTWAKSFQDN